MQPYANTIRNLGEKTPTAGFDNAWEFPIATPWADARMSRTAGETSQIIIEIIERELWTDGS